MLWKNGKIAAYLGNSLNGIAEKDGEIYTIGTKKEDTKTLAVIWKGSTEFAVLGEFQVYDIFISGNDVYALLGRFENGVTTTYIWKNGSLSELDETLESSYSGNSIFVSGSDVYVSGQYDKQPVYWKNGVMTKLTDGAAGMASKIVLSGSDIYIVGSLDIDTVTKKAVFWKNGEQTTMDNGQFTSRYSDVFIHGNDVYVAGSINTTKTKQEAFIWKNGEQISLGGRTASVIWVK